jgi:tetratricopeptide (TPR) repeat protein
MGVIEQQAHLLLQQGKWEEAEAECRRLIVEHPINARVHALLGICMFRQQKFASAAEELRKAVILDPTFWEAFLKLAQAYDRLQRYEDALTAAREGLKLQPNDKHLELMVQSLSRLVKERPDGWEKSVHLDHHRIELHGPSGEPKKPEPEPKQDEELRAVGFVPRAVELR